MEANEDFQIREATEFDKEAVLQIRENVYGGRDYLPDYYDFFVAAPNVTPFVLLDKERIIAFRVAYVVDGGNTVVNRAGRISLEYEGKQLFGYLDSFIGGWAKSKGAQTKAFTASATNTNVSKASFREQNQLILSKAHLIYILPAVDNLVFQENDLKFAEELHVLSQESLQTYMSSEEISHAIFPADRISINSVPFQLLESNIPLITQDKHTVTFSNIRLESKSCKGLLSFGTLFRTQAYSYQYTIDIYGTDMVSVRQHILRHLLESKVKGSGSACIILPVPKDFPGERVDEIFLEFGSKREDSNNWITCDFLFERKL